MLREEKKPKCCKMLAVLRVNRLSPLSDRVRHLFIGYGEEMAPKRANRLPLIGILCLAFVLIVAAALFIWLKSSTGGEEAAAMAPTGQTGVPSAAGREGRTKATTNAKTDNEDNEKRKTAWTNGTTVMTTTTTTTTTGAKGDEVTTPAALRTSSAGGGQDVRRPTTAVVTSSISATEPLEELTGSRWQSAHVPICKDWAAGSSDECVAEEGSIASPERRGQQVEDMDPLDWLRPLEYALNMSLSSEDPHRPSFTLDIQLSILVELSRETSVIPLHCGSEVDIVEEVRIWSCSSETFVCVRSMSRLPSSSLLLLHLLRPLPRASLVRLQFPLLRVPLSSPNAALFVHVPSPWERHQSWMIGSQFPLAGGVRSVFPSVDSPSGRAILRLCLTHSKQTIARSNAPIAQLHEHSLSGLSTSCFRDSPALPPAQFAFLLFRNLRPVTSPQPPAAAAAAAAPGPLIELFIGAHLNPPDYAWAVEESRKTMERMRQITSTEYALEKLTLVSSPLQMGNDAMGALGLAHIRDSWMEYPKFVHTHELLIGQLIRQWTSNVLSLCDQCIQQGLGLYLEWMVGSEQLGTEPKTEFGRRFGEARQRLMAAASSTMTEGSSQGCAERVAVVVHMLERSFGARNVSTFVAHLFRRHGWAFRCTTTAELGKLFLDTTGMPEAQRVFDSFLRPSSAAQIPLVHILVHPEQSLLRLSQKFASADAPPLSIPVEIVDDTHKGIRLVLNSSRLDVPFVVSSFAVAQPTGTFARFVYNSENYAKLAKCVGQQQHGGGANGCPAISEAMLQSVWDDLCWALFNGRLNAPTAAEDDGTTTRRTTAQSVASGGGGWPSLFRALSAQGAVSGDCACCMQSEEEALRGPCRWTWLDRCARVVDLPKR
uniref:Uncharacterized protein n=1 Tax=Globodera rostochiensis TaxID=31243 RepID=A0A914H9W8_GLORO